MTYKMEITGLSHDDLVNILSTSLYSNSDNLQADYDAEKYADLFDEDDCYEDKMAKILLAGGQITLIDMNSYDDIEDDTHYDVYGIPNENWRSTELIEMTNWCGDEFKVIGYNVDLQTIMLGINKSDRAKELAKELLIDEEGDMYTAYNLVQCVVFDGEEIYG